MEVDKPLEGDSYLKLEELEAETNLILESIRGKTKSKLPKSQLQSKSEKLQKKDKPKDSSATSVKGKKKKNGSEGIVSGLNLDRKMTVEILDDASPDATPRIDDTKQRMQEIDNEKMKLKTMQLAEQHFRKMQFNEERTRVLSKKDTFVAAPGVTAQDVDIERKRLVKLEEAARARIKAQSNEVSKQKKVLKQDRAALKIQCAFRGHIGRQKFFLTKRLKQLTNPQEKSDWIEVSDPQTGETWYYNMKTEQSQWKKPLEFKSTTNKLPQINNTVPNMSVTDSPMKGNKNDRDRQIMVSMSLPSLEAVNISKKAITKDHTIHHHHTNNSTSSPQKPKLKKSLSFELPGDMIEYEANKEVEELLGINKLSTPQNLLAPDGTFKPQLRTTVLDALLQTRFDSVSTVLADKRWFEQNEQPIDELEIKNKTSHKMTKKQPTIDDKVDYSRLPLVSTLTFNKKKTKQGAEMETKDIPVVNSDGEFMEAIQGVKDLTFKEVEHIGFDVNTGQQTMCFGCWSSGTKRKCAIHDDGTKLKASQTMLLCRNWELDVMRRRYRSEEIQEIFLQKDSSLRFDVKHRKFTSVVEQRHPIYRMLFSNLDHFNSNMMLFEKVKRWCLSFADELRNGRMDDKQAKLKKIQRSILHHFKCDRFHKVNKDKIPIAPITGISYHELRGEIQYLFKHKDFATSEEVDLITILPIPIPKKLYIPREYHISVPKSIPMPQPSYNNGGREAVVYPSNSYIADANKAAWFERIAAQLASECVHAAKVQVQGLTPVTSVEVMQRTKKPPPSTIKFASIGQKPTPGNLAVGGLSKELLVNQLISTYMPAQYGNFMVMDKSVVSPGVSPEAMITFQSIGMAPITQHHVIRPLEHPLNYRRTPTITLNSSAQADDRHKYGINRPEQTGEQESHGFRTTAWSPMLLCYSETDPQVFIPGQTVVSLNTPKANISYTTHADHTYPFCEPSTRDNSTLDFYHLLLTGTVSPAKPQIFTALTVQEPGQFLKAYRTDVPMGHLVVSVYRSWAFTQTDTIQEFKTDDGISYWYHRKTGQTFWERPLYEAEEASPLIGGTQLDMIHPEEPSTFANGTEGAKRRYLQGEFREQMLRHIETKKDALNRRKSASTTVKNARERGTLPEIPQLQSIANNANTSFDFGSKFDFTKPNNQSMMPNTEPSTATNNQFTSNPQSRMQTAPGTSNSIEILNSTGGFPPSTAGGMGVTTSGTGHGGGGVVRGSRLDEGSHVMFQTPGSPPMQSGTPFPFQESFQSTNPSGALGGGMPLTTANVNQMYTPYNNSNMNPMTPITPNIPGMPPGGIPGMAGIDPNMFMGLSQTIGAMMNGMLMIDKANPQDMIQLGLGMGMALMSANAVQGVVQGQLPPDTASQSMDRRGSTRGSIGIADNTGGEGNHGFGTNFFPSVTEEDASNLSVSTNDRSQLSRVSTSKPITMKSTGMTEPIGQVHPTTILSADKTLDHIEESDQRYNTANRLNQPLNTLEKARNLKINDNIPTDTPDTAPPKVLTEVKPPNAEAGVKEENLLPVLAYPELSTVLEGGAPDTYNRKQPAGLGTSFVSKEDEINQLMVKESKDVQLRRTVMPLPVGFFEAIEAKHVAKQVADYLPQVPNLPQSRTIGRVKPRSAAADWLMINFDPWSAGKNPLGTEFVSSLMAKADKLVGGGAAHAADVIDTLKQSAMAGAVVTVEDEAGLAEQRNEISKAQHMAEDFKKLCSLCRHSKFTDAEQLISQPDWSVPIDYQDDQGNTLLHIVAQNGNKRMVKLCLRRGAALNLQNLTGQTPLHFAYGYGYAEVGDYLVGKGADDSIRNKDGLTCYEGLGAKELSLL